jgi:uncharacterized protein involved in response to NO
MQRALLLHGQTSPPAPLTAPHLVVARKGFRVFFLLAAVYASVFVPLWLLVLGGVLSPNSYLDAPSWHAHEMLFGFTLAVVAGFLLTAVGNWTGRETVVGWPLLGLAGLWVAGRVVMLWPSSVPRGVPAVVDLAFLPALTVAIARPLVATKNRRNLVMAGLVLALFAANGAMHLDALGRLGHGAADRAAFVAVDLIVVMILIIAGRVFPMFTRNATGSEGIVSRPLLDGFTVVGALGLAVLDTIGASEHWTALVAGLVGVLAVVRAARWGSWHARRAPLLWILHLGYGWVCFGLLMRAIAGFSSTLPTSLATHAITVGAIGSLTLGMMARVSLGHTGRPLVPPSAAVWAFGALSLAAFARVVVPLLFPDAYFPSLVVTGALWTAAFVLFLVSYAPALCSPRVDGKAG